MASNVALLFSGIDAGVRAAKAGGTFVKKWLPAWNRRKQQAAAFIKQGRAAAFRAARVPRLSADPFFPQNPDRNRRAAPAPAVHVHVAPPLPPSPPPGDECSHSCSQSCGSSSFSRLACSSCSWNIFRWNAPQALWKTITCRSKFTSSRAQSSSHPHSPRDKVS